MQAARRTTVTSDGQPAADAEAPRGRKLPVVIGVAVFVLALDVVTKIVVVHTLAHHAPIRLLGGFLTLQMLRNSGAAFSIGTSMTIVFTVIAVAVIIYILRAARKLRSLPWAITLGLLLGGATGNLSDRIFRAPGVFRGDVVDWIELPHWPVFNLADSAIVCGGVIAVLLAVMGLRMDGTREGREHAEGLTENGPSESTQVTQTTKTTQTTQTTQGTEGRDDRGSALSARP